ncbi:MAG: hypothetical protein RDU20_00980 [Desulfomonilaceae bacterium]|nr:hypothetical protein [Desulfomonilaceae bacterium]
MRVVSSKSEPRREVPERKGEKSRNASPHDITMDLQKLTTDKATDELKLAALVETTLRAIYPCEVVRVEDGIFTVDVEAPLLQEARLVEEYNRAVGKMPGVKAVRVHLAPSNIWGLG